MKEQRLFEANGTVDVERVMEEIHRRIEAREREEGRSPAGRARALRERMLGPTDSAGITVEDCEILPRNYVIDWHIPVLGPIHSLVRRIVNGEIRRYLEAGLIRQSRINRHMLRELQRLQQENQALRRELGELQEELRSK